jgi:hypothetical protein
MATYKIIGGDQKEYGPANADEIRQWLAEGRLNAQSQIQAEGSTEWKPLGSFPEFAGFFAAAGGTQHPFEPVLPASFSPQEILARDYDLDIGNCVARSWNLLKQHFWPTVGISFLVLLVQGAVNQLLNVFSKPVFDEMIHEHRFSAHGILIILGTSVLFSPVYTLLMGGLMNYYLKLIRGEPASVPDAFSGFTSAAGQLVLLGLVSSLVGLLGYVLCLLPGIYLNVSWAFAIPLVIDRRLDFWSALELSRKVVTKHWFIVFAFVLIVGLLAVSGILACCIGIFVTMPLGWMALMYAYEDLFGRPTH